MKRQEAASGPPQELVRALAELAKAGAHLADDFGDNAAPGPKSALRTFLAPTPGNPWTAEDVRFLQESLRGLVLAAGAQLSGVGVVFAAGPPVRLHPLATLVRAVSEACGKIWWLSEPLLSKPGEQPELAPHLWGKRAVKILHRSLLARLDALYERRRRRKATPGLEEPLIREVMQDIDAFKQRLIDQFGNEQVYVQGNKRRQWRVAGERLPDTTDMVIAATEYAYGESYQEAGMNPYPMYSGYAHASIEMVFAHTTATGRDPLSVANRATPDEIRRLGGTGLRGFAVGFEMAAHIFDYDLSEFRKWEAHVDRLVIEPN